MEKDLQYITKILKDLHYKQSYIDMLISYIIERFEESSLTELTPQFLYTCLVFEEGRHKAKMISQYFEDMKNSGTYTNIIHQKTKNPTR